MPGVFDVDGRRRKARTTLAVLRDACGPLEALDLLDVGGSTGIIDAELAGALRRVVGLDLDATAIRHAHATYARDNLAFVVGDALALPFADASVDVVVCSHVYEHVPDPHAMMREIGRVLRPAGVCYFGAGNRLAWNEPHYGLPLLSVLPRPLADLYLRVLGRGTSYYEKHLTWWGLRRLVRDFALEDYTRRIVDDPARFEAAYMIRPGSLKQRLASLVVRAVPQLSPGYVCILRTRVTCRARRRARRPPDRRRPRVRP
jgi:SAM-dependent methyltransferase